MYRILDKEGNEVVDPAVISVYIDDARFIPRAEVHRLKDLPFAGINVVSAVYTDVPYDRSIKLVDLKLNVQGPKEDQYYGALPYLVKNIRRGNTLIVKDDKHLLGRKGLMKFFDMRMSYIGKEQRHSQPQKDGRSSLLANEKNYILAPVLKALAEGSKVEVLKTLKANGENVQVSFCKEVAAWIVTSKNVGLLARTKEDVAMYRTGGRFNFAIEMANVWFDKLASMPEAA